MDIFAIFMVAQDVKVLEIIMLRQQVRILQRTISSSPRILKPEKLILNERHLHHVLKEYVAFYKGSRPHQGISQQTPIPRIEPNGKGIVVRRDVRGGIVHGHYRLAA